MHSHQEGGRMIHETLKRRLKMGGSIKDYLLLWKEKYKKEIKEAKRLSVDEKFNMLIHLHSMGLILMELGNKDKKLELYQSRVKHNKDELKEFIRRQLSK